VDQLRRALELLVEVKYYYYLFSLYVRASTMHRVGSAGNTSNSSRPRKERRLTYVLNDADDTKHCAGINCLAVLKSSLSDSCDYLFTGSRDGTLKRWALGEDAASCSSTFESHVDWERLSVGAAVGAAGGVIVMWDKKVFNFDKFNVARDHDTYNLNKIYGLPMKRVNDVVLAGDNTLISCSSDATVKTWDCLSDGICTRTLRQHSDYVTCLAGAAKNSNVIASGGLGGEVFIWDLEAALVPVSKSASDAMEEESTNGINGSGNSGLPITGLRSINSSSNISLHTTQPQGYSPVAAKGHKESVYALAMNDSGTTLVSGGTEKVVRVWDPRTGSKTLKLRGHTDNIRALLLDSTGRYCLSGSSDSMIRLWDLGQQRCVHSYAVHTDSVWALASTPTFSHVYSGGRDLSLYLTDLATRESLLLCTKDYPILQLALHDDGIWAATTDSSVHRWPAEGRNPQKVFQRGGSFLAGNLSFSRARACLEGSNPVPVYKEPSFTIPGTPGVVQHEILNNRRHVLTKDTEESVKLWEITRGVVVEDYGKVSFEEKKEELFETISVPAWFTTDTRLGSLSIHLDTPQCFSAEMYSADLNTVGVPEDHKINLAEETFKGLFAHWLGKRWQKTGSQISANGDVPFGKDVSIRNHSHSRAEVDDNSENHSSLVHPSFEFSTVSSPSIITEGSQGGPWRKKITDLDGTEDEKDIPWWCLDCVLNKKIPSKDNTKCSFYLHACEGSTVQVLTQGKLSAPRILRIHKVVNYVMEKMVLDKPLDGLSSDGAFSTGLVGGTLGDVPFRSGFIKPQKLKPSIEILCNNQAREDLLTLNLILVELGLRLPTSIYSPVLAPEMSLATVRAYIWKKPEDLVLNYRVVPKENSLASLGDARSLR
ncbi:hypothetical protein GIB67_042921, partial [Kingdonia uniflora]